MCARIFSRKISSKIHKPPEVEGGYPDTGGGEEPPFPGKERGLIL